MRAKRRTALEAQLYERLVHLDHRARGAVLRLLETVIDIDRPRATRLIEAIATLVTFATRTTPKARR